MSSDGKKNISWLSVENEMDNLLNNQRSFDLMMNDNDDNFILT